MLLLLTIYSMSANDNAATTYAAQDSVVDAEPDGGISRNLFFECRGPSFGAGIGYDQRFKPNSVFGFRVGVGFVNGSYSDTGWFGAWDGGPYTSLDFKGMTFPLEVNAIMGKRASKFELGIGATPCVLKREETTYMAHQWQHYNYYTKKGVKVNIMGSLNVGYRLQRKSGFFMRTGLTFLIGDLECSPFDGILPVLNLAMGYTIR